MSLSKSAHHPTPRPLTPDPCFYYSPSCAHSDLILAYRKLIVKAEMWIAGEIRNAAQARMRYSPNSYEPANYSPKIAAGVRDLFLYSVILP